MRYMQQNICFTLKDIKIFTLIETITYGEKKNTKGLTKRLAKHT